MINEGDVSLCRGLACFGGGFGSFLGFVCLIVGDFVWFGWLLCWFWFGFKQFVVVVVFFFPCE